MPRIMEGDLVKSGGVEFHIKHNSDGELQYWCGDTHETIQEDIEGFVERCRQRGNIIIEPGDGKFSDDEEWAGRERFVAIAGDS